MAERRVDPEKAVEPAPEPLLYVSGSASSCRTVQAGQLYRLSVPQAAVSHVEGQGRVRGADRVARLRLVEWKDAHTSSSGRSPWPPTATAGPLSTEASHKSASIDVDETGVGLVPASRAASGTAKPRETKSQRTTAEAATVRAAAEICVRLGARGSALDLFRFQLTERYDGRQVALVGAWTDGSPLPGAERLCIRVEAPAPVPVGVKRELSGGELRSGGFLGVAKRLRDVPPPVARPQPPPGAPPPAGFFDSDSLTAAALSAKILPRPHSEHANSPPTSITPPGSTPATSPPCNSQGSPIKDEEDLERDLEALKIAESIAGENAHKEIKPEKLGPLSMAIGERKDVIRNIVRRTMDELVARGQCSGRSHPSLAALTKLAKLLSDLDAAGMENPKPPPPPHTLFAMDVIEQPDIARVGEPLSGWFPPSDFGEKYVASVEQAFAALQRTVGPSVTRAVCSASSKLTDGRLLLSPFVRTFPGRVRFRALLVILREAAVSMAPVARVASHLTMAAMRRLMAGSRFEDREDAIRSAWDAVDALRPTLRYASPDLFFITSTRALEVLRLAADVAGDLCTQDDSDSETDQARRLVQAEAIARIGEQEVMAGLLQDAIEHLFEAWSLVLGCGHAPSRLEARIILNLTEAHHVSPTACQLAERVYWCRENDEDLHFEARACLTLAFYSGVGGRADEAKHCAERVFEIVESMPSEQRDYEGVAYQAASMMIMMCLRIGRMEDCFACTRRAVQERLKHSDWAHPVLDTGSGGFRNYHGPALDFAVEMMRFGLFLYAVSDPHEQTSLAETLASMGEVYTRQGQWRRAALCFADALERHKRFRKAYPLDHPRIVVRLRLPVYPLRPRSPAAPGRGPAPVRGAGPRRGRGGYR